MQDECLRGILHNRNGKKVGTEQQRMFLVTGCRNIGPPSMLPPPCTPEGELRRSLSGNLSGQFSTHSHYAIPVNYCRVRKNRNVEDLYEKYMGDLYRYRVDPETSLPGRLLQAPDSHSMDMQGACAGDKGNGCALAIVLTKDLFIIG